MSELSQTKIILIKYFLIGDIDTNKTITEFSTNAIGSKEKKNAIHIFKRICKSNERRYEERNIISAKENKYFFTLFQPNIVFIVYADGIYPEKLIFTMFDEVRNENVLLMINEETKELNPNGRQSLKQIIEKYQDKAKIDKIISIQKKINEVQIEVKENMNKIVDNNLEESPNEIINESTEYSISANEIRKINICQKFKMWLPLLIIFLIIFIIILSIIF